jgi:D-glycero-D-manno-heptose 1,7-bisphosphate phosphatase
MALVDGAGCWAWTGQLESTRERKPALFLDRDGVLVRESCFLRRPEDVDLMPGAARTIATFNHAKIPIVVVTNQSGVARGYFSWQDFEAVQAEISRQLSITAGAHIDAVFACAYHSAGHGVLAVGDHPWRKPNAGMLLEAAERLRLHLGKSWMVGDRASDLAAGRAARLAGGLHVMTGHGTEAERRAAMALARSDFQVKPAADLGDALLLCQSMSGVAAC